MKTTIKTMLICSAYFFSGFFVTLKGQNSATLGALTSIINQRQIVNISYFIPDNEQSSISGSTDHIEVKTSKSKIGKSAIKIKQIIAIDGSRFLTLNPSSSQQALGNLKAERGRFIVLPKVQDFQHTEFLPTAPKGNYSLNLTAQSTTGSYIISIQYK